MLNRLTAGLLLSLSALSAHAGLTTTYYGDDDGFGIGVTAGTINPTISNQGAGEAPLTDLRLIGNGSWSCSAPGGVCGPFNPTGSFNPFSLTGTITGAVLTLRTGSFDSAPALDAPNRIFLDGVLVDPAFINSFSSLASDGVETFANPPELTPDAEGVYQLRFGPSAVEIGGKRYCLRTYNGSVPGPTIRVPAGTDRSVRVNLYNEFTSSDYREIAGMEGYARSPAARGWTMRWSSSVCSRCCRRCRKGTGVVAGSGRGPESSMAGGSSQPGRSQRWCGCPPPALQRGSAVRPHPPPATRPQARSRGPPCHVPVPRCAGRPAPSAGPVGAVAAPVWAVQGVRAGAMAAA